MIGGSLHHALVAHVRHLHELVLASHDWAAGLEEVVMFLPVTVLLMTDDAATSLVLRALALLCRVSAVHL